MSGLENLLAFLGLSGEIIKFFIILYIAGYIGLCMISVSMAEKRGRSQVGWFFLSFFIFPIIGMILLAFLGETYDKRRDRIMEEEQWRRMMRD